MIRNFCRRKNRIQKVANDKTVLFYLQAVVARGGRFLEAPLIGDKQLAVSGRLIILAAGDQSAYDDCASCFEAIGKKFYLG